MTVRKTSLAGKPTMLFLLFGERADPRLLPVAMAAQGRITPITLDHTGWRRFDELYFATGTAVPVYRDGAVATESHVRRGMWSEREPLYTLPGCESLRPLAAIRLDSLSDRAPTIELLATSSLLPLPALRPTPGPEYLDSARALTARVAQQQGINEVQRGDLALVVRAIHTGATTSPTIVGSYVDQGRGTSKRARHLLVIGDSSAAGYTQSLLYVARDSNPELRRLIDHLDLNGDGVDEIVLERSSEGSESYLSILQYTAGRWKESASSATSWCSDPRAEPDAP